MNCELCEEKATLVSVEMLTGVCELYTCSDVDFTGTVEIIMLVPNLQFCKGNNELSEGPDHNLSY